MDVGNSEARDLQAELLKVTLVVPRISTHWRLMGPLEAAPLNL